MQSGEPSAPEPEREAGGGGLDAALLDALARRSQTTRAALGTERDRDFLRAAWEATCAEIDARKMAKLREEARADRAEFLAEPAGAPALERRADEGAYAFARRAEAAALEGLAEARQAQIGPRAPRRARNPDYNKVRVLAQASGPPGEGAWVAYDQFAAGEHRQYRFFKPDEPLFGCLAHIGIPADGTRPFDTARKVEVGGGASGAEIIVSAPRPDDPRRRMQLPAKRCVALLWGAPNASGRPFSVNLGVKRVDSTLGVDEMNRVENLRFQ